MNLQNLSKIVIWLAASVLAVDAILVSYILSRRLLRFVYFRKKDRADRQFAGLIQRFLEGEVRSDALVFALSTAADRAARNFIEEQILKGTIDANRHAVTDVFFRSGRVNRWATEGFGQHRSKQLVEHIIHGTELPPSVGRRWEAIRRMRLFCIRRSRAVAKLGQLEQRFAQVFMREALLDPSPFVERADVVAMGHNRQSYEVPILLELLKNAAAGLGVLPILEVKAALARYPIMDLKLFVPFLNGASAEFRFLLVDTVREICDVARNTPLAGADFPESLYHWFMDNARFDQSADVRARSARVIRHFHNSEAAEALRILMADPDEFARLHAVRACGDPYYSALLGDLVQRTTDPKWRVREAAVKTLATFGEAGRRELSNHFLSTTDNYASEQIAEQMQRGGMISSMLRDLGSPDGKASLATNVCSKLVHLKKTSLLSDFLLQGNGPPLGADRSSGVNALTENTRRTRARLLEILLAEPTPQVMTAVERLASSEQGDLSERAKSVLNCNMKSGLAAVASTNGRN